MNADDSTAEDAEPPSQVGAPGLGSSGADRSNTNQKGERSWANSMRERFGVPLPPDLMDWWDSGSGPSAAGHLGDRSDALWSTIGPGEYRHPATPQSLLSEVPDAVWPPLMPPNFLPLVGNGTGDWLCLRLLDPDVAHATGRATDVCHWYHGGGDWLPWGHSLAEALLFDWMLPSLPSPDRRHAIPAEPGELAPPGHNEPGSVLRMDHPWVHWVHKHLPAVSKLDTAQTPLKLGQQLIDLRLCEIPVRCQLTIDCLDSEVLARLDPKVAEQVGLSWNDLMRWCFDLEKLPEEVAVRLVNALGISKADVASSQQDWFAIEHHGKAIASEASDLSWGHDLLGYCRFRRGDHAGANASFAQAIRCSVFTDQSVRLRTHWATSSDGVAKFAARFIDEANTSVVSSDGGNSAAASGSLNGNEEADWLGKIPCVIDTSTLLRHVGRQTQDNIGTVRNRHTAMLIEAAKASRATSPATAARLYYSAGWDLGAEPLKCFGELLDQYISACHDAGWSSHERLARVHRQGLKARYNL